MFYRYSPLSKEIALSKQSNIFFKSQCSNGIFWIFNVFGDCVDTNIKLIGFCFGLISLFLWLVPLIPQLYENYKTKRCDGLSIYFLLFWIIGDTCNMIGAILTHQQPLQQIISVYYIMQDIILLCQFLYYTKYYYLNRQNAMINSSIVVPVFLFGTFGFSIFNQSITNYLPTFRSEKFISNQQTIRGSQIFESYKDVLGYVVGSLAAICYFAGRIPQILQNYYRKSCDGLSLVMFYIIISANLTYGISVMLESTGWVYLLRHFPWLAGSLGCCIFDVIMIIQNYYYKCKNANAIFEQENVSLLEDNSSNYNENES